MPTDDHIESTNVTDSLQLANPIPKISAYIRRKSESYLARRRSDDYQNQLPLNENRLSTYYNPSEGIKEEDNKEKVLEENLTQHDSVKHTGELL